MNKIIIGLLALSISMFVPTNLSARQVGDDSQESIFKYVHTRSPEFNISLEDANRQNHQGIYSYETYVVDLSPGQRSLAKQLILDKFNSSKLENQYLQTAVLTIVKSDLKRIQSRKGRAPSNVSVSTPAIRHIIADDIASLVGAKVQDIVIPNEDARTKAQAAQSVSTAIIYVGKVNNLTVQFTLMETQGVKLEQSIAIANTIGNLSGGVKMTVSTSTWSGPIQQTIFGGYNRLLTQNLRLRPSVTEKKIVAPIDPLLVKQYVQVSSKRITYVKSLSHMTALSQLPNVCSWIQSWSSPDFVASVYQDGPIAIISEAANKAWDIAIEAQIDNYSVLSPSAQKEISKMAMRNNLALNFGKKVFSASLSAAHLNDPQAFVVWLFVGGLAVGKALHDLHKLSDSFAPDEGLKAPIRFKEAIKPLAKETGRYCGRALSTKIPKMELAGL